MMELLVSRRDKTLLELATRCWKVKRSEKLHSCANMDNSEKTLENLSGTNGHNANPCVQLFKKVGHIFLSIELDMLGSALPGNLYECLKLNKFDMSEVT